LPILRRSVPTTRRWRKRMLPWWPRLKANETTPCSIISILLIANIIMLGAAFFPAELEINSLESCSQNSSTYRHYLMSSAKPYEMDRKNSNYFPYTCPSIFHA
jgi:hypothetical protein